MVVKVGRGQMQTTLTAYVKGMGEQAHKACLVAAHRGRTLLVKTTPADTGATRQAWAVLDGPADVKVINYSPIAGIVETGARPHGVNAEGQASLAIWVRHHSEFFGVNLTDSQVRGIVFGICMKIKKEGQKGHFMMRDAQPEMMQYLKEELTRFVGKQP